MPLTAGPAIRPAQRSEAPAIARLITLAMGADCCLHFAGPGRTLADFQDMLQSLVERDDSQYSHLNTIVASVPGCGVAGIAVSYDGAALHTLRRAFVEEALERFGRDFSAMADETGPGELYIDSLAVDENHRHRGIATALLHATARRCAALGLPATGLLVDKGNPGAMALYTRAGFTTVGEARWGGHPMWHMQRPVGGG